ncbi:TIR-like protein FxsC [Micromonospora sp. S4605]|uniref:TIR-like protein FxsC n=1 Tax=Micromonospora sp. S4605 TaxID=1420897 RepID=UPI0013054732|nr:TIR-like protein FxsC [Micromonospora sp. S4605]
MTFLFFLSYSGEDARGGYVDEFYADLADVLMRRTTEPEDSIGFQYTGMREGTLWRPEVADVLRTCRVFVPLYSPRYFRTRFCGQEWGAFAERQRAYEQRQGCLPELIVPVLWETVFAGDADQIPRIAADVWAKSKELAGPYQQFGLRRLVKLKTRFGDAYDDVVEHLAGVIIEAARQYELPASDDPLDFDAAPNVFESTDCGTEALVPAQRVGESAGGGPRHVHLVVAAPTVTEAAQQRTDVVSYGNRSEDWMPYRPVEPRPVVRCAMRVAEEQDLTPHPVGVLDRLSELLDKAEADGELVVLLVDAWATRIPAYTEALTPYDSRLYGNCGVLLPWNPADEENKAHEKELHSSVLSVFNRNARLPHPTFRGALHSVDDFMQALREVLVRIQSFVFEQHDVPELANVGAFVARPQLEGPGAR